MPRFRIRAAQGLNPHLYSLVSLRLLQIITPSNRVTQLDEHLDEAQPASCWTSVIDQDHTMTSVLIRSQSVETLTDALTDEFKLCETFRLILLPVEATYPKVPDHSEAQPVVEETPKWRPRFGRISREELIEDIEGDSRTTPLFMSMVALSTIVACVGLYKDSPAILIGAMVIAPLLGPNMALALGTTLGEIDTIKRAIRSNLVGLGYALAFSIVFGFFFVNGEYNAEIQSRTSVGFSDIVLALASGAAGALAITSGVSGTLVGVMVAVALLPPTAACGMFISDAAWHQAARSATLTATNVTCINLSATAVFLIQGISPESWIKKERVRNATVRALLVWILMLVFLAILITFSL